MTQVNVATPGQRRNASPHASFEELFEAILPRAYVAASYLTRDSADAEDLIQEAALNAYAGYSGFQPGTNFKAWFLKILTNTFYLKHRRERLAPKTVSLDGMTDETPDLVLFTQTKNAGLHNGDPDPARTFMSKLAIEQVADAIRMLPIEFRTVAALHFIEDFSYPEIAEIVGCPIGTVRSRLHRGRKLLQAALWKIAVDHGLVKQSEERELKPIPTH